MKTIEYINMADAIKELYEGEKKPFKKLREMKYTGELNLCFDQPEIYYNFEKILRGFVDILEDPKYEQLPCYRTFCLYSLNSLTRAFAKFHSEFGLYFSSNDDPTYDEIKLFRYFPAFFQNACKKYNIEPYASMDMQELAPLIRNHMVMGKDDRGEEKLIFVNSLQHRTTSPYCDIAEQDAYDRNKGINTRCFHVSRDYGDGYGYDILVHEKSLGEEHLIEVKTGNNDESFQLSRYEHKVMYETADLPKTKYFIYHYNYIRENGLLKHKSFHIYRFDKSNHILVDIDDANNICSIQGFIDYERDKDRQRIRYMCIPKKLILSSN